MLVKALAIYDPEAKTKFTDVEVGSWYEAAIASAENKGITNGKGNNKFEPDSPVVREEMMTLTARAMKELKGYAYPAADKISGLLEKFADKDEISDISDFKAAIAMTIDKKIVEGSKQPDGSWKLFPKANIKRGEVAKMIYFLLDLDAG